MQHLIDSFGSQVINTLSAEYVCVPVSPGTELIFFLQNVWYDATCWLVGFGNKSNFENAAMFLLLLSRAVGSQGHHNLYCPTSGEC